MRAKQARKAWAAGIILEPGKRAAWAKVFDGQARQLGQEKKEPAAGGEKLARGQREGPHIGHRLHAGARLLRPLLIPAPGQGGKALGAEDFPHRRRTQRTVLLLEHLADFIDRMVLFAPLDNEIARRRFFRLSARSRAGAQEEGRMGVVAKVEAQDPESARGIAEGAGDFLRSLAFDEIGAEGLVLALFGQSRFEEEALRLR